MPEKDMPTTDQGRQASIVSRFEPGKSGNPKGRPRKKPMQSDLGSLQSGLLDRVSLMMLDEGNRLVSVKEGDKVVRIPALQVLLRTLVNAGAKGDVKAATHVINLISEAEMKRVADVIESAKKAVQYKEEFTDLFEKHEREGLDPPEIFPHPDDVVINLVTGQFVVDGPKSKTEAIAHAAFRQVSLESLSLCVEAQLALAKDPKNRELKQRYKELEKYRLFLEEDAGRLARRKAISLARAKYYESAVKGDQHKPPKKNG